MVKLAFILLLLVSSSAFAAPPPKNDVQQKTESIAPVAPAVPTVPAAFKESGAAQPSSETTDVTDAPRNLFETLHGSIYHALIGKKLDASQMLEYFRSNMLTPQEKKELMLTVEELTWLGQFQFYDGEARFAHLLESYLVEKYGADPTKIRPAIRVLKDEDSVLTGVALLSKLLTNGNKKIFVQDYYTIRGRVMVEAMDKVKDRGDDDFMDEYLRKKFRDTLKCTPPDRETIDTLKCTPPDRETIRKLRADCSLDDGDERVIKVMEEQFGMEPLETRYIIASTREVMLQFNRNKWFEYSDSNAMDKRIKKLFSEKEIEIEEATTIDEAVSKARKQIELEKENLDATELAAYNDDQKMSEFLGEILLIPTEEIVDEARWRLTFDHAVTFDKSRALRELRKLVQAGTSYQKYVEDHM